MAIISSALLRTDNGVSKSSISLIHEFIARARRKGGGEGHFTFTRSLTAVAWRALAAMMRAMRQITARCDASDS